MDDLDVATDVATKLERQRLGPTARSNIQAG
jgi:hypothetical protein